MFRHGGAFLFPPGSPLPWWHSCCLPDAALRSTGISSSTRVSSQRLPRAPTAIIQQAEKEYGEKSRVLYGMDRGMTLQLAGEYQQSNAVLEQAEEEWIVSTQERYERKRSRSMTKINGVTL